MFSKVQNAVGGSMNFLMNLVPFPNKITILPVSKYGPIPVPAGAPFIAMFNPDQWAESDEFVYNDSQETGTDTAIQRFDHIKSKTLSFEILIDGTGASGEIKEVTAEIQALRKVVGFSGKEHRPNKLFIIGGYFVFKGILETLNIEYKLFRPNYTPLRAVVKMSFRADTDPVARVVDMDLQSADLTHERTILSNERLDQLSDEIYGSPRFLLQVARANGLTTFRQLPEGKTMLFPPLEK